VNRGGRRRDVLEHRRIEVAALDVDVGGRGAALLERQRQRAAVDGAGDQTVGVLSDPVVGDRDSGRGCHVA